MSQKSFHAVGRRTGLGVVLALVAALFALTVSSPASAVENRHAVTALLRLSSGSVSDADVTIYQKDPDPATTYQYFDEVYAGDVMDVDLPPGTYKFEFYSYAARFSKFYAAAPATGADIDHATPVVVGSANQSLGTITFPVRAVTLNVKDNHAAAVPGMDVHVALDPADLNWDYEASGRTDDAGNVTLRNLPTTEALYFQGFDNPDDWQQKPQHDDSAVASLPAGTSNGSINLTMAKRSSIAGKVTGTAGAGLSLVDVNAYDATTGDKVGGTVTDSQGNYAVTGLPAGDYRLEFADELSEYTSEFYDNVPVDLSGTATPVTVAANTDVTGKDAQLTANPVINPVDVDLTGVVHGAGSSALSNVEVRAYRNDVLKASMVTGRDGRYSFSDLTSGSYKVEFRRLSGPTDELPYVDQWYLNARSSAGATPLSVTADTPGSDRDVTLPQYGWITGAVTGAGNQPVDQAAVSAVNLDGYEVGYDARPGGYKVLVPPGKYYLRFDGFDDDTGTSYVPEWYDNMPSMVGAKTVTVTSGGTTSGINAHLTTQLEVRTAPTISGAPVVGRTLTATTGGWNLMADNEYTITWLRGTTPVGSGPTYVVKAADAGSKLTVRVDAVHYNLTGQALSASTATVKHPSATTVTGGSPKKKTVKLVVKVTGTGLADPGGTVTIRRGTTVVKTGVAVVNGVAVVKIGSQPTGKRTYKAFYSGTSKVLSGSSAGVTVKIKS